MISMDYVKDLIGRKVKLNAYRHYFHHGRDYNSETIISVKGILRGVAQSNTTIWIRIDDIKLIMQYREHFWHVTIDGVEMRHINEIEIVPDSEYEQTA